MTHSDLLGCLLVATCEICCICMNDLQKKKKAKKLRKQVDELESQLRTEQEATAQRVAEAKEVVTAQPLHHLAHAEPPPPYAPREAPPYDSEIRPYYAPASASAPSAPAAPPDLPESEKKALS